MKTERLLKIKMPSAFFLRARFSLLACLAAFMLMLASCGPEAVAKREKAPSDLIALETMSAMLADIHLIEGARLGERMLGDSLQAQDHYRGVWAKYGVQEDQYKSSFEYYSRHPDLMDQIYEQAIEQLNRQTADNREE